MSDTPPTSEPLTRALSLTPVTPEFFDDAFVATTQPCPWPKAYGGDLVGAAAAAVMLTVGEDRALHSMHGYFMRPAEIGAPVRYEVERLRDGRGYSTRQVRAFQNGKPVYVCLASFHVGEQGGEYTPAAPAAVPQPETLPTSAEYLTPFTPGTPAAGTMTAESRQYWSSGRSFDLRHVPGPVYLRLEGDDEVGTAPQQAVWVRPFDALRDVPGLSTAVRDRAALAFACDYTILEPVLRALGLPWALPGLVTASLDHTMWFHRAAALDDWLLYTHEAGSAHAGRGLGLGRFFTRSGTHLATVAQEGLVRTIL